ncbi:LacI family DNA-binding transcriptional regulator [Proteiniclasticum ruminis]|uniref:LacI family DNA-binding transcriptional regulator n=1 Tax=Proteiniclasticum ruminis TaxID=398199 RepID=UPI0028A65AB9|nr:LacI family DNA-binding transcriptional regulator [Proteiniclasticum ruminis]
MSVTMKDIARKCGVSVATVSKVLNEKDLDVSTAIRDMVKRTSKEMGYVLNVLAQSMKTKNTKTLGIMMPDIKNAFYTDICRGAEDMAMKSGYSLFLCNTDDKIEKEIHYLEKLMEKQVDGIIINASMERNTKMEEIQKVSVLFAVLNHNTHYPGCSVRVVADNENGMREAVNYLAPLGHRRIFYLAGETVLSFQEDRLKGYKKGLSDWNLSYDERLIAKTAFSIEASKQYLMDHGLPEGVTAICAGNDLMAQGVLQWARDKNIRIPDDLSIVGYDDSIFSRVSSPMLTTINQQSYKSGELLAEMLLKYIEGFNEIKEVLLEGSLVIRGSTGPVRTT